MERDVTRIGGDRTPRKIGEAPNLGRVLRSPLSGTTNRNVSLSAAERGRRKHRVIMTWSVVFAVVSIAIVMFFIISHFRSLTPATKSTDEFVPSTTNLDEIFSEGIGSEPESPSEETALEFVRSGLANRDPERVTLFFKLPPDKAPADAIRILEGIEKEEGSVSKTQWLGTAFTNGGFLNQIIVRMEKDGSTMNRLAQIVPQPDGKWLIDFDSYIGATSAAWETIVSGNSPSSTVRVFVATDNYYNGIFADDTAWQAYGIVSPDSEEFLYAYAKRQSPQFLAMEKILESEESLHRVTLEITTLPGARKRQFQISRVVAENWVVGEKYFDEAF